jgi:hypothetical protein
MRTREFERRGGSDTVTGHCGTDGSSSWNNLNTVSSLSLYVLPLSSLSDSDAK